MITFLAPCARCLAALSRAGKAISGRALGPAGTQRARRRSLRRSAVAWRLVDVAVGDRHSEALLVAIALGQVLGDGNRAVPAARAADRDHQVRATLGDI